MARCLQLARYALGYTSPNPLVGAVIVHKDKIIGEGYHQRYGEAHAEPNAINSVKDKALLKDSTLYVNLEPCSHYGKTPPCADLIISHAIPRVVIGTLDPNPEVAGRGMEKLRMAGVEVHSGYLQKECYELNKHFFTFHEKKRPYILLKWAQTQNGFIDFIRDNPATPPLSISNELTKIFTHKQRAEYQSVMVGTNTAILDNPKLTLRNWHGKNPVRIALDKEGRIPESSNLFDNDSDTIIYGHNSGYHRNNPEFVQLNRHENSLESIIQDLYKRNINSLLVEGGSKLLTSFITKGLWDEANIEISPLRINEGVWAPVMDKLPVSEKIIQNHRYLHYRND